MNCLESRRRILACPHEPEAEGAEHLPACAACRSFLDEALELDAKLADAIAVPVPDDLAWRASMRARGEIAQAHRGWMALAATLVLAVAVAAGYWLWRDDPFARAGIDFVIDQEASAILTAKPADPKALARVARALHVRLPERPAEVRYIGTCPFEGTIAHHVVMITPEGKATLLLFPEKHLRAAGGASARGLHSVAKPAGIGSVVIVGSTEAVHSLEDIVTRS